MGSLTHPRKLHCRASLSAALFAFFFSGLAQADPAATDEDTYVDTDGSVRSVDREYERFLHTREPHHLRSWAEMGAGLALGSAFYWVGMDRNVADWDNPSPEDRFNGAAWVFDNNSLPVNFVLHPVMGAVAYAFARANHHGVATSAAYSFVTSFIWEFVLEWKEKVSINDVLVTPATGIPVGEFFHKLGLYLDSAEQPGTGTQIAQWTLGTGVQLDRSLDGVGHAAPRARDSLGLTSDIWHDFEFNCEFHSARSAVPGEYAIHRSGFRGRLVSIPGYLRPGTFGRFFQHADLASFEMQGEGSRHGAGFSMASDTLLLGYHAQQIQGARSPTGGHAATVGASLAFRFFKSWANEYSYHLATRNLPGTNLSYHVPTEAEQFGALHLPGPAFDWHVLAKSVRLELSARAHVDFAGVGAPAFYDWAAANLDETGKHILHRQGYFYGWGGSAEVSARLVLGPVQMHGAVFYGRYDSQEGLDRRPKQVTVDVPCEAELLQYQGSVGLQPPGVPVAVGVSAAVRRWDSWVGGFRRRARVLSRGLHASVSF